MEIKQFRYSSDNLGYLIYGKESAVVIDGGAVEDILSFIKSRHLKIKYVVNTHSHPDHTVGNQAILDGSDAEYIHRKKLINHKVLKIEGKEIHIYHTPGHTDDSISFYLGNMLITGDTLFNGKVGRCFSGDLLGFLKSIKMLIAFPGDTIIYAGHDYVKEYLEVAKDIEPDNSDIDKFLEKYDPGHVYSTLSEELKMNPTLRFNDKKMISILQKRGLPVKTEFDRWQSLFTIVFS